MLADDLLEDARDLATKGDAQNRKSCMRRAISTAYYAVFHLLIEDFVSQWAIEDQRARLARMFTHQKMRDAPFKPMDKESLTPVEVTLTDVIRRFGQLQSDRHRADYDVGWNILPTDVNAAITQAEAIFEKWHSIRDEEVSRNHLLSMFSGKTDKVR
jgi:hypothetical protein